MPITPPLSEPVIGYTLLDIIDDALVEVGIKGPGEPVEADVGQWAFRKTNYLLDTWATSKKYVYASAFNDYVLPTNLPVAADGSAKATIGPGPGATYFAAQRPVKILSASAIINNTTPPVLAPISIETSQWWAGVTLPGIPSMYPTNLFYNPAFPNGELYLWPLSNTAFGLRLETWVLLSQFGSITDPIGGPGASMSVPPGYRAAIMLSLAESLQPGSDKLSNPQLKGDAATARAAVFGNNGPSANISTLDSGMPGNQEGRRSTTFSYRSRTWT
jgi:hypothetical protein